MRLEGEIRKKKAEYMTAMKRDDSDTSYCVGWIDALSWVLTEEGLPIDRPDDYE